MAVFDDPRRALWELEQELKAEEPQEEPEEEDAPGVESREENFYYESDYRRDWKSRRRKKRKADGCGGLRFLATVELLAIAALIGWWILWFSGRL